MPLNLCYKNVMKIKTLIILIALSFLMIPSLSLAQRMGIAAVVNDDIITHSDVEGRVQLGLRASNLKDTKENRSKLELQALNTLIEEQLRLQEAKRLNLDVQQEDIEKAIDNIAAQNKVDGSKFRNVLKKTQGTLPSLKRQIESQMAWTQVVRSRLRPQVNVTEADIDGFIADLDKHEGKSEYNIAEIVLFVNGDAEDGTKKALATDLVKQLKSGASFSGIARQFSQGREARNGGAIGWVLEDVLDPQLSDTIKKMPAGSISQPVKTDLGYHVILLRNKRIVSTKTKAANKVHIKQALIPLSETATDQEITIAQTKAETLQSQTSDCDAMDQLITQQNNTMSTDIGLVEEDQVPPAVKEAITGLDEGQASIPIRAKEGFLILMVCGREEGNSGEAIRDQIANKIGAERLERLQQRYVRDLRATAYIDIKN